MENDCYGVELHMHLDGCVPAKVIWNSAKRKGRIGELEKISEADNVDKLWDWISVNHSCASLKAMLDNMQNYMPFLQDDEIALRELCHYAVRHQYKNKIYYTETRYCPHLLCDTELTPSRVVEIVSDELNKRSEEYGIVVKQILCCMRQWLNKEDDDNKGKTLDQLLVKPREIISIAAKYRNQGLGIVGVDLAGNESDSSSADGYGTIFSEAKKLNLHITIHAGEANNVSYTSIYDAIENMHAERLGHGYKTIESNQLTQELSMSNLKNVDVDDAAAGTGVGGKYSHIHIECCPTSSIITNSVNGIALRSKDYTSHPVKYFNDKKLNYSVSTDDPQVLRCSYQGQLAIMADRMDISVPDIKASILRAAKCAFLDGKEKEELMKQIETRLNKHFQIFKPKDYHNDSFYQLNLAQESESPSASMFWDRDDLYNDEKRTRVLKYLTFTAFAAGLGSIMASRSQSRK